MAGISYTFGLEEAPKGLDAILAKVDKTDKALQGADKTLKALNDHLRMLKAPGEIAKLTKDIENFGKAGGSSFKGIGQTIEGMRSSAGHFMEFFGAGLALEGVKLVGEGIAHVIEKVADLGREALTAAAGAERLDLSLKVTLGEGAEEFIGWIDQITPKTEFVDDQLKKWGLSLANAGIKGEDLKDTIAAALDVAGKRGPEAMDLAVEALTRATLAGKIEGRALRGLGIPVAELAKLDQFKGLNEAQINKKLETTQIKRDDLLNLIAGPDKLLGNVGLAASQTLGAKFKNLQNLPEQFFEKFAETPAYDRLKGRLDSLFESLDPSSERGQRLFTAIEGAFDSIVTGIEKIDVEDVAQGIESIVEGVSAAFKMVGPLIEIAAAAAKSIAELLGPFLDIMKAKSGLEKSLGIKGDINEDSVRLAIARQNGVEPTGAGAGAPLVETRGAEIAQGVAKGITGGTDFVTFAMTNMGKAAIGALDSTLERHSPPRVFLRVGQDIPRAVAMGIEDEQQTLDTTMRSMVPVPENTSSASTMSGGMPPIQINVNVGDNVNPDNANEVGRMVGESVLAELMRFLEQRGAQQGTG